MPSGHQWLQRLVWAVVYVFGVQHGIGNDTLSNFSAVGRHIGHLFACRVYAVKLERQILSYHQSNKSSCSKSQQVGLCRADDMNMNDGVGATGPFVSYIFLEAQAKDYQNLAGDGATGAQP